MRSALSFFAGLFFWLVSLLPGVTVAQAIDNTVSFRNIDSDHYFRIYYENDYFTATDRDYTQGVYLEWVNPRLKRFPLSRLLWHPRGSVVKYGLAIEDDTYTPNHFDLAGIQYGDRPFADALFLKTFVVATNAERRERVVTQLSTGVIGPWAGGAGMQEGIHRWLHDLTPHGWPNQIKNDVVLNYQLNYERELLANPGHFSLATSNSVRVGTLSDLVSTGLSAMAGSFRSPFGLNGRREPGNGLSTAGMASGNGQSLTGQQGPLMGSGQRLAGAESPLMGSGQRLAGTESPLMGNGQLAAGTTEGSLMGNGQRLAGTESPLMAGRSTKSRKIQWYVYDQLSVNLVGYDASLQGGVFTHSSPYTIADGKLNRVTIRNRCGLVLIFRRLYLEYYQTGLTAEFHSSIYHRTGGIQAGFGF